MRCALLVLLVLGLGAACGGGGGGGGSGEDGGSKSSSELSFTAKDYSFDPQEITVNAGDIQVELVNDGTVVHDFTIDKSKFQVTALAGRTKPGKIRLERGTYEFYCSIAGHRGQGMEGKLTLQ